jgi:hypothetical protein
MQCTYESRNARVQVELEPSLGASDSRITSILWAATRKSHAFDGWKTSKGIRVGSTFRAFASAYPGWKRFDGIPSLDVLEPRAGASTRVLRAAFTMPLARMQAGAAGRISSLWTFTTGLDCDLHVAPASGGLRLNGACAGTLSYYYPLRLRPTVTGVSITSVQAADARSTRCQVASGSAECTSSGNSRLWPIDVTLGLSSPASSIEVAVDRPSCRNCLPFRLVVGG